MIKRGGKAKRGNVVTANELITDVNVGAGVAGIKVQAGPFGGLVVYGSADTYSFIDGTGNYRLKLGADGAVTFGPDGGWYIGTGTFATPTTGWKCYADGGLGVLEFWNGGVLSFRGDTEAIKAAYDGSVPKVLIGRSGIELVGPISGASAFSKGPLDYSSWANLDENPTGQLAWTDPTNARYEDSNYASALWWTNSGLAATQYLKGTSASSPNIPLTATITGMQVRVKCAHSPGAGWNDSVDVASLSVQPVKADARTGNASAAQTITRSMGWLTFGSSSNLLGATYTPAEANATTSGVALRVSFAWDLFNPIPRYTNLLIDRADITWYYTDSVAHAPFTVNSALSTYTITNLNADLLDGVHASSFTSSKVARLSSDFTTTSTTATDVTGLLFAVGANEVWGFDFHLALGGTTTNGQKFAITVPTGATLEAQVYGTTSGAAAQSEDRLTASGTLGAVAFNTVATDGHYLHIQGVCANGANAGNVQLQIAKVTSGTAKVLANSWLVAYKIA